MEMDTIDRLTEDEVPYDEVDEAYGIEEVIYCPGCQVMPHPNPDECRKYGR
jgi:hypothetical protein